MWFGVAFWHEGPVCGVLRAWVALWPVMTFAVRSSMHAVGFVAYGSMAL